MANGFPSRHTNSTRAGLESTSVAWRSGGRHENCCERQQASIKKPVAVYVEKVYEEGDVSALGIGT